MKNEPKHLSRLVAACLIVSACISIWSLLSLRKALEDSARTTQEHVARLTQLSELRLWAHRLAAHSRGYLLTGDPRLREAAREAAVEVQESIQRLQTPRSSQTIAKQIDEFLADWTTFAEAFENLLQMKETAPQKQVVERFRSELTPLTAKWMAALQRVSETASQEHGAQYHAANQRSHEYLGLILTLLIASLFLVLALFWLNLRRLANLNRALQKETMRTSELVRRFHLAEQAADLGIWEWQPRENRLISSARCEAMLGYAEKEIGPNFENWLQITHPEDRDRLANQWRQFDVTRKGSFQLENRMKCKNGTYRWILCRGSYETNEAGTLRVIGANIDITDKKEIEGRLNRLAEELKKSNTDLERFAYIASHDLKEPLRMISTYLGLLMRQSGHKLDDKEREYVGFALEGAQRLNGLVDALLRFSRLGHDRAGYETVDVERVVKDALTGLETLVRDSKAQIEIAPLPTVWADSGQLTLVFQNLISNALKFRKPEQAPH
ncbi:PAS domain-containing protein, partial [bacterium]|nr:PAS domain-containing protein [bacterium]